LSSRDGKYYKYLDSYRFIAVFLVILMHWLPSYLGKSFLGKIGVDMFFVLSGFLITEILLKQRDKIDKHSNATKKVTALKIFYIRRALRIFPIYYVVIFIFFLLREPDLTTHLNYYLFYGANYLLVFYKDWAGMFTHLWSLAVEEQFYLIWPLFILLLPFAVLKRGIVSLLILSLLFVCYISFNEDIFQRYNLLSCLNVLGVGSLLAFLKFKSHSILTPSYIDHIVFWPGLFIIGFFVTGFFTNYFLLQIVINIVAFVAIKFLITRENKMLDIFMNNPFFSFLGKISYGLYLYHNFIPWLLRNITGTETQFVVFKTQWFSAPHGFVEIFIEQFLLLLIIASLSWFLLEKPINKLKYAFPYT
jgi:peptidoglycan/LPS O-acetylase OafA/YrhL